MGAVVQDVAVAVVSRSETGQGGHLVGGRGIRWQERVSRMAREHILVDIFKGIFRRSPLAARHWPQERQLRHILGTHKLSIRHLWRIHENRPSVRRNEWLR